MKKAIALFTAVILLFSFCCCGRQELPEPGITVPSAEEMYSDINSSTVISDENTVRNNIDYSNMIIRGEPGGKNLTDLMPLPDVSYTDKGTSDGLSAEKLSHSHGPASGGQPHYTVVSFQKSFDSFGALTLDTVSQDKVLYLTFDCGYEYDNLTNKILDVLKEKKVPAAFFCTLDHIRSEHRLIARMINEGHIVGNHSASHPSFAGISREKMISEIQETENYLRKNFGYAAKYFRFPAGEYNENALDLVESLGYMSVFWSVAYDDWDTSKVRGKDYAVTKVMERLHDGAVILLHSVSHDNAQALGEIIDKARAKGYEFRALTDYRPQ